jgi:hypothetical protein
MTDILVDDNFDIKCDNGDFVTGNSDAQNIELILLTAPGDWADARVGMNISRFINAPLSEEDRFVRLINEQIGTLEGMKINKLDVSNGFGNVELDAVY